MNSGKFQGRRLNTQNSVVLLHTSNEQSKKEIKITIPFTIASKIIQYFGINLTRGAKKSVH